MDGSSESAPGESPHQVVQACDPRAVLTVPQMMTVNPPHPHPHPNRNPNPNPNPRCRACDPCAYPADDDGQSRVPLRGLPWHWCPGLASRLGMRAHMHVCADAGVRACRCALMQVCAHAYANARVRVRAHTRACVRTRVRARLNPACAL